MGPVGSTGSFLTFELRRVVVRHRLEVLIGGKAIGVEQSPGRRRTRVVSARGLCEQDRELPHELTAEPGPEEGILFSPAKKVGVQSPVVRAQGPVGSQGSHRRVGFAT